MRLSFPEFAGHRTMRERRCGEKRQTDTRIDRVVHRRAAMTIALDRQLDEIAALLAQLLVGPSQPRGGPVLAQGLQLRHDDRRGQRVRHVEVPPAPLLSGQGRLAVRDRATSTSR